MAVTALKIVETLGIYGVLAWLLYLTVRAPENVPLRCLTVLAACWGVAYPFGLAAGQGSAFLVDDPLVSQMISSALLLVAAYLVSSQHRLQANPDDKLLPAFATIAASVNEYAFKEDARTGQILWWADTWSSLRRLLIALGLARYGLKHSVAHLFKALFDAATYMDLRRLPELFCGFRREKRRGPTLYPVACAPQAWASATPFTLLEAALGLEFDAGRGEIRLRNPHLPAFLNEVVLRDLRLGPSSVDLRVSRHGDDVSLEVLRTRGQIQVSIVLAH